MNHWYLVSSLPYLRFGEKPPIQRADFLSACSGWLSEPEIEVLKAVLDNVQPPEGVAGVWWNGEVQLRDAVVRVRAKSRGIDASRYARPYEGFSATIEKLVSDAFARPNPLEVEEELDRTRWMLAEDIALTDAFGFPAVLAFAVKLRIAERWAVLEDEAGKARVEELILSATTEDVEPGTEI